MTSNLPAILAGIASMITAIGGLFIAFRVHNNHSHAQKGTNSNAPIRNSGTPR